MKYLYITNDLSVSSIADKYGIDIIFIDLETLGKDIRQAGRDTVKSKHSVQDISLVKESINNAEILVRVNPINPNSECEIQSVIEQQPDIIMLPMVESLDDVKTFLKYVEDKAKTCFLIETKKGADIIEDIIKLAPSSLYYIGLNDLHLSMNQHFMFEPLADGTVERIANIFKSNNITFGFGGIARIGDGMLPAESILIEHKRLGSSMVILSRTFCNYQKIADINEVKQMMRTGINDLREFEKKLNNLTESDFENNKKEVNKIVHQIKDIIVAKKGTN